MKPLLKWAGGKRWLLPVLQGVWASYTDHKLVEPFTGGMAVTLGLNPLAALLNDANPHLINFYKHVSRGLKIDLDLQNQADFYYAQRSRFNQLINSNKYRNKEAAAIFYYLMRTGFNGLCRFNSSGEFNVPFGQHNKILYRKDFSEYKNVLSNWQLESTDFACLDLTGEEFIYADPPYDVQFTRYSKIDFTWKDQQRLAHWLVKHKGPIIASNQATPRIIELYKDLKFSVCLLQAPRMIACNGNRKPAVEILAFKNIPHKLIKSNISK